MFLEKMDKLVMDSSLNLLLRIREQAQKVDEERKRAVSKICDEVCELIAQLFDAAQLLEAENEDTTIESNGGAWPSLQAGGGSINRPRVRPRRWRPRYRAWHTDRSDSKRYAQALLKKLAHHSSAPQIDRRRLNAR